MLILEVLQVLNSHRQLLLAEMALLKHKLLLLLKLLGVLSLPSELSDRLDDVILDVFEHGLDERAAHISDALLQPYVIVQEVSLACQDRQVNCEVVVLAVNYRHQALLYFLGNVKDSGEVHDSLVMAAELADAPDHECLVILPQCLEYDDGVHVVSEELRQQN